MSSDNSKKQSNSVFPKDKRLIAGGVGVGVLTVLTIGALYMKYKK